MSDAAALNAHLIWGIPQRDELLDREIFRTLIEASMLIEKWRKEYNQVRPHSALDYGAPTPEAIIPLTLT